MTATGVVRRIGLLVALAVGLLALSACDPVLEQADLTALNALRTSRGLPALVRDAELDRKASAQAVRMARQQTIFHSSDLSLGVSAGWSVIGENVGVGGSIATIQSALEGSPGHMANMVDTRFRRVGIGAVQRNGRIYLVQVFVG
jgi:uncharacterized protein YkwD